MIFWGKTTCKSGFSVLVTFLKLCAWCAFLMVVNVTSDVSLPFTRGIGIYNLYIMLSGRFVFSVIWRYMKAIWLPLSTVAVKWLRGRPALRYHLLLLQSPRARVIAAVSPLCELVAWRWVWWCLTCSTSSILTLQWSVFVRTSRFTRLEPIYSDLVYVDLWSCACYLVDVTKCAVKVIVD